MTAIVRRVALAPARAATAAWVGVTSIAALCTWLAVVGAQALTGAGRPGLWRTFSADRGVMVGPALIVTVAVIMVAEQLWPAVRRPLLARAHLVDAAYLALFAVAVIPLLALVQNGFAVQVGRYLPFLRLGRLPLVPRLVAVGATLVGMDAMNWCGHVANHRFVTLWRLHALHHSQEDMSVLTTFRTHPLVHAAYLPSLLPALVLGASGTVPAVALIVYGCLVTLPHANLRWTFGPLKWVIVSPAYHRIHHARELGPSGTVNFGFVLVAWDWVARRAQFPTGGGPVATGIAGRPVPVEQEVARRAMAGVVLRQLALPFRRYAATDGPQ
jgi:sterol desaturase/sphingolipid hydroxylase (fatty acid hydroxylase superfamily)